MGLKSGIYKIMNITNNNVYIGSAINLVKRKKRHLDMLIRKTHSNTHLQNAFNLYKESSFVFETIEYCEKEKLLEREQYWIDLYMVQGDSLYNIYLIAGSPLGSKHSEESKIKIGIKSKGRTAWNKGLSGWRSKEGTEKFIASVKGKPSWNKGLKMSDEMRGKVSVSKMGNTNMLGKHHTEETKAKISQAKKGCPGYWKGKHQSEETKMKLSLLNKGQLAWNNVIPHTEEEKKKLSESAKKYWENKRKVKNVA